MNKLIILTWISASWKTTTQEELMKRWWKRPINFTTREPRNDDELDEYIFLTKEQYFLKMQAGDFLEHTNYNGNWYGISNTLPEWNVCIVLDPVGREQVLEKIAREKREVEVRCIYLEISRELQEERLKERGTEWARSTDIEWFSPNWKSEIFDGSRSVISITDELLWM